MLTTDQNKFLKLTAKPKHRMVKVFGRVIMNVIKNIIRYIRYNYYIFISDILGVCNHIVRRENLEVGRKVLPFSKGFENSVVSFNVQIEKTQFSNVNLDYFKYKNGKTIWFKNESTDTSELRTLIGEIYLKVGGRYTPINYFTETLFLNDSKFRDWSGIYSDSDKNNERYRLNIKKLKDIHVCRRADFVTNEEEDKAYSELLFEEFGRVFYNDFKISSLFVKEE